MGECHVSIRRVSRYGRRVFPGEWIGRRLEDGADTVHLISKVKEIEPSERGKFSQAPRQIVRVGYGLRENTLQLEIGGLFVENLKIQKGFLGLIELLKLKSHPAFDLAPLAVE